MYNSKKPTKKTSRLRGFEEFLSSEKDAATEEGAEAPAPTEQEPTAVTAKAKKAAGKRALTAEETGRYEKQAKRRLIVDSPTQDERGPKLMESAFRSAPPVLPLEEEPQESSVGGISHQVGLRSVGPALAGEASSYHPPDEEGGDETGMGDAESVPTTIPDAQTLLKDSTRAGDELIGGSTSSLALLPIPGASSVSPTTGLLPQPIASESQEKVDYEASDHDEVNEDDKVHKDNEEDDEEDEYAEAWDALPLPSPGKASAHTPITLSESPVDIITPASDPLEDVTSALNQQAIVVSTVTTPPLMKSAPLVISLRPAQGANIPSSLPAGVLGVHPSSPSTLGIAVPSTTASPVSSAAITPQPTTFVASSSSPAMFLSPVDVPNLLGALVGKLEQVMRITVEAVSAGRGNFESFKPFLLDCLNSIERLGDAPSIKRCADGILCLERDLKALQDLNNIDLEARIESTFAEVRSQAMHRYDIIQKSISEREARIVSSKSQYEQWQTELTSATNDAQATKETIARLQEELAQQEAKLSRDEDKVKDLTCKHVEAFDGYRREVQALEEIRKEVDAVAFNEEELRRRATAVVRAAYEQELTAVETRLASVAQKGSLA